MCCSNYDKRYYWVQYKIPSLSEEDFEDHPYDPEDPRALHIIPKGNEVSNTCC